MGLKIIVAIFASKNDFFVARCIYHIRNRNAQHINIFTPNNDNINDELDFFDGQMVEKATLKIYNRWGRLVFESNNPHERWKAEGVPDGTYFYELHYRSCKEDKSINGTIQVLR